MKQFHHAAVAGTFDRLHSGHKSLLAKAFSIADSVSIGITTQAMTRDKQLANIVESYSERKEGLEKFLAQEGWQNRTTFFPLDDLYGPALTDQTLDALVVSTQTQEGGEAVNRQRQKNGLTPLSLVVADYIVSQDNSYLSSTRVREGEINRDGLVYKDFLRELTPYRVSEATRHNLKNPLGELLTGSETEPALAVQKLKQKINQTTTVFTVGDIVSQAVISFDIAVALAIIDGKSKRQVVALPAIKQVEKGVVINPAGTIGREIVDALSHEEQYWLEGTIDRQIIIEGEEDLVVLPLILLAPLQSVVCYGQPGEGLVMVPVTEDKKTAVVRLLSQRE